MRPLYALSGIALALLITGGIGGPLFPEYHPDDVYRGGRFNIAGGKPSVNIARWDATSATYFDEEDHPVAEDQPITLTQPYPNPFSTSTMMDLTVTDRQSVTISVYDVSGRHIRVLFHRTATSGGIYRITLDGSDLPTATYLVRAIGETGESSRLVVHL